MSSAYKCAVNGLCDQVILKSACVSLVPKKLVIVERIYVSDSLQVLYLYFYYKFSAYPSHLGQNMPFTEIVVPQLNTSPENIKAFKESWPTMARRALATQSHTQGQHLGWVLSEEGKDIQDEHKPLLLFGNLSPGVPSACNPRPQLIAGL